MTGAVADGIFDLTLAALVVAAALAAVAGRQAFAAAVFFIVYGVFVAIAWLRLGATDIALAEAAIGAGLTGVLVLGALARLPAPAAAAPRRLGRWAAGVAATGLAGALAAAVLALPPPRGLQDAVAAELARSGAENPVTAVLLNFRAWDTLLESVVLLAALVGVWTLTADRAWGGRPGVVQHARPGGVLASFGRVLPPVGLLVGVYLVWAGTSRPGGAFQGGTVLAAVALLVVMAGLASPPRVAGRRLRAVLVAGPAVFLAVGLVGAAGGGFLRLPPEHAKALILIIEAALTLSIAATLSLLVLGRPQATGDAPAAPPEAGRTPAGTRDRGREAG